MATSSRRVAPADGGNLSRSVKTSPTAKKPAAKASPYHLRISRLTVDKLGVKLYDKASAVVAEVSGFKPRGEPAPFVRVEPAQRGQVTHAVIYDPSRNEMFTASRGSGAFLNDRRIRVSGQSRYHDALVGAHLSGAGGVLPVGAPFDALLTECAAVRRVGATVLDLAYVAAGRLDGFCGVRLKPWDCAAGGLLVLEAGGLIGDFDGEQQWMRTGNVLAATPRLFPRMLSHLQGTAEPR